MTVDLLGVLAADRALAENAAESIADYGYAATQFTADAVSALPRYVETVQAVLDLHRATDEFGIPTCWHCSGLQFVPYPCATVVALSRLIPPTKGSNERQQRMNDYDYELPLCDPDGTVRSGAMHHGQDYECTGSAHFAGAHFRCTTPAHAAAAASLVVVDGEQR